MKWPDLVTRVGRHSGSLAFIYVAEVGITVENSAFGVNPALKNADLTTFLERCNATLALGAEIPDGAVDELFPLLAHARATQDPKEFRTRNFHVVVHAGEAQNAWFGCSPGRAGRSIPIRMPNSPFEPDKPGSLSNWEVAMKNLLRLDLQRLISAIPQPITHR